MLIFFITLKSASPTLLPPQDHLLKATATSLLKQLSPEQTSEMLSLAIVRSLNKSDQARLNTHRLFVACHEAGATSDAFFAAFKLVLHNLTNLESEHHFVKSNVSLYAARAVCDQLVGLSELAQLMRHGAHYPLFFLCMQSMHKLRTAEWLRKQLEASKVNLVEMLAAGDRTKDRLIQILEDRELSFVYPMLRIETTLLEKIQTASLSANELREWIESHVDADIRMSVGFIQSLVSCVVKNAAESSLLLANECENSSVANNSGGVSATGSACGVALNTSGLTKASFNSKMDKLHVAKQKQAIEKYQVRDLASFED